MCFSMCTMSLRGSPLRQLMSNSALIPGVLFKILPIEKNLPVNIKVYWACAFKLPSRNPFRL